MNAILNVLLLIGVDFGNKYWQFTGNNLHGSCVPRCCHVPYFSIDNAHPKLMYTAVYRACSFFTNLYLFCIDNARVI